MADFPYGPDFDYKVKPSYAVLISEFANRYEQRRLKSSRNLRTFELSFTTRSKTEMDAVLTFFADKKESLSSFTLEINEEDVLGRFALGTVWYKKRASNIYDYGFSFQEVIV